MEIFLLPLLFITGIIGIFIAQAKNRGGVEGFALGLLLGPFGLLIEVLLPTKPDKHGASHLGQGFGGVPAPGGPGYPVNVDRRPLRPCPFCAEIIIASAKLCRYCQRDVEPLATAEAPPEPAIVGPTVKCSQCGRLVPKSQAVSFLGRMWCPEDYSRELS